MSSYVLSIPLKSVYGDDLRRLLPVGGSIPPTLDELKAHVRKVYGIEAANDAVVIKYEDEEGDLVTLVNMNELFDSINGAVAQQSKSFKIHVVVKEVTVTPALSVAAPVVVEPVTPALNVTAPASVPVKKLVTIEDEDEVKASSATPAAPEPYSPSKEEWIEQLLSFSTTPAVLAALPNVLLVAFDSFAQGGTLDAAAQQLLASDPIRQHQLVQWALPYFPKYLPIIAQQLKPALDLLVSLPATARNGITQWASALLPVLLPEQLPRIVAMIIDDPLVAYAHFQHLMGRLSSCAEKKAAAAVNAATGAANAAAGACAGAAASCMPSQDPLGSLFNQFTGGLGGLGGSPQMPNFATLLPLLSAFTAATNANSAASQPANPFAAMNPLFSFFGAQQQQQANPMAALAPLMAMFGGAGASTQPNPLAFLGQLFNGAAPGGAPTTAPAAPETPKCSPAPAASAEEGVHEDVSCDGCGQAPLKGIRYKCTRCFNFDLCSACESKGTHPSDHPLIKLHPPAKQEERNCSGRGGWRRHHGHHSGVESDTVRHHGWRRHHGQARGPCWREFIATAVGAGAGVDATDTEDKEKKDRYRARFISDRTIPDRSEVSPNAVLIKTWLIENSGKTAWPTGVKLVFLRGDRELSAQEEFDVTAANPGQQVEVSAMLNTPAKSGRYQAFYRLGDKDRNLFGPRIWADIVVTPEDAVAAAAPVIPVVAILAPTEQKTAEPTPEPLAVPVPIPPRPAPSAPSAPAAEPIAAAVEAPASAPTNPYAIQLAALENMGFVNRELNEYLLEQNGGNVQQVCNWLLEKLR